MIKWTYTILNIIFFTPVIVFAVVRYQRNIVKNWQFILASGFFGFLIFFIVDLTATLWGAWSFDYSKTLGIRFGYSVIEELIWAILVCMMVAIAIVVATEKEER